MSGGSHDYLYHRVEEEYVGRMHDKELDDLMQDIVTLLHDLEWYDSADTGEEEYRRTVSAFKAKWVKGDRCERLQGYIDEEIKAATDRLIKMLNEEATT